ncbi:MULTISPECIES: hypothetical protein [Kitasatospora]|uniref:DNA-binding protein n=1 Tax=Kitasatospora setae (strain ATCC 33774 / DSM 43861 / JCM 3304 / KCC A-0304 / NBRC 14216 / KM-6054) TaxID=452652 RepID=E4NFQ6_KITSK|nr:MULTISPECIES: hypothetical protein [Kitasatospora]BAJ30336.1 hypothetical protein KSE_45550 [Kitasatospora setae KM-6054]
MLLHRSAPTRAFDPFPHLRPERSGLSKGAYGLAVQLLTSPDGCDKDGRQLAAEGPDGRAGIARMLRELRAGGFYWVIAFRLSSGRLVSQSHLFDTPQPAAPEPVRFDAPPQVAPDPAFPGPGAPGPGRPDGLREKTREGKPSLPDPEPVGEPTVEAGAEAGVGAGTECEAADEAVRGAAALLLRVVRPEPRLRIGEAEALELAPLVVEWQRRGSTADDLARALLPGLPVPIHSAVAVLRSRLQRKLPPEPGTLPGPASGPALSAPRTGPAECVECRDPIPRPGTCGPCLGRARRAPAIAGGWPAARVGAQQARSALRSARTALPPEPRPRARLGLEPGLRPGPAVSRGRSGLPRELARLDACLLPPAVGPAPWDR